jgi:hypothetical protein
MGSPGEPVAPAKPALARPAETVVASPSDEVAERHWADTAVVLVVARVAPGTSYGHILHVAVLASEPLWLARAFPLTVDGLALAALRPGGRGRAMAGARPRGKVSVAAANVGAQVPKHAAAARPLVSAWPPLARFGTHVSAIRVPGELGDPEPRWWSQ